MPKHKDLKRLTRSRMRKTGESYTTARSQLLDKRRIPPAATPETPDYAALAGMSDEAVAARTGCTWERWVRTLDHHGAAAWPHREIARYVSEKYKLSSWWAQSVTVGYERIKGLREIGQRRSGSYEATKSKTLPVPLARLYRAFSDPGTRERWLGAVELTVRKATPERSLRLTWEDGTSVECGFFAKGEARSQVQVQHGKLASRADADSRRAFWGERLAALAEVLAS
jgi:hypothetical protein